MIKRIDIAAFFFFFFVVSDIYNTYIEVNRINFHFNTQQYNNNLKRCQIRALCTYSSICLVCCDFSYLLSILFLR